MNTKYDNQKIIDLLEIYKEMYISGENTKIKIISEQIQEKFSPLIISIIHEYFLPYVQSNSIEFEELYNEASFLIFESIPTYNEELSCPTTFFYKIIKTGLTSFVNNSLSICPKHQNNNFKKAVSAKHNSDQWDTIEISVITGMSPEIVANTWTNQLMILSDYESADTNYTNSTSDWEADPAQIFEKTYTEELIKDAVADLPQIYSYIITSIFGIGSTPKVDFSVVAQNLKITIRQVQQLLTEAIHILKNDYRLRELYKGKNRQCSQNWHKEIPECQSQSA